MNGTALAVIETITAAELFKPGTIDPLIERIKTEVRNQAERLDISTPSDRTELASLAYKVARSKTFIDGQRKALVTDEKRRLAKIDAEGKRIWDDLESFQLEIRKPLTDWEQAEKDRVAGHEAALLAIPESPMYGALESADEVAQRLAFLKMPSTRDWQEFSTRYQQAVSQEIVRTEKILATARAREEAAAELSRLRAESAAREQKERDERIAREATERAQQAAEAERQRAERAQFEAEAKAQAAEAQRLQAEERHARELKAQEERAEANRVAAIEAEKARAEAARQAEDAATAAREKDKEHRRSVNGGALAAFINAGLTKEHAKVAVEAIANHKIPNVRMDY